MHSAIGTGSVWHWRRTPVMHRFVYRLYFSLIDLAEIETVFSASRLWSIERFNLVSYRRRDYLAPRHKPLDVAVRDCVHERTGRRPAGRILMLGHLRQWGMSFNPVVFYFCLDERGRPEYIVAEIHNTPWNERHAYVLDCRNQAGPEYRFTFSKDFHVSPFLPMDIEYDWRFRIDDDALDIHMALKGEERECFVAGMSLSLIPMTGPVMRRMPIEFPLITLRVVVGIYWQAFRLWLRKVPFYPHPDSRTEHR